MPLFGVLHGVCGFYHHYLDSPRDAQYQIQYNVLPFLTHTPTTPTKLFLVYKGKYSKKQNVWVSPNCQEINIVCKQALYRQQCTPPSPSKHAWVLVLYMAWVFLECFSVKC
ncbi:mitochondrial glutamate carrier 1-like [Platysternon megacephalum]|uniref:Mitochondrial glutamate carrier 1-like n=1 Tax=Platysternon megacephalum TaxID=55544 RepID=A0A4D9DQR7_9SAUR|nr:mitochondrial glutamate carrier 1-like [Platysternon megacephalum]